MPSIACPRSSTRVIFSAVSWDNGFIQSNQHSDVSKVKKRLQRVQERSVQTEAFMLFIEDLCSMTLTSHCATPKMYRQLSSFHFSLEVCWLQGFEIKCLWMCYQYHDFCSVSLLWPFIFHSLLQTWTINFFKHIRTVLVPKFVNGIRHTMIHI